MGNRCVCSADESTFTSAFCSLAVKHCGCLKTVEQDIEKDAAAIKAVVDKILPAILTELQKAGTLMQSAEPVLEAAETAIESVITATQ